LCVQSKRRTITYVSHVAQFMGMNVRSRSLEGVKIISFSVQHINRPLSSTAGIQVCIPKQQCSGCSCAAAESYFVRINGPRSAGLHLFMHFVVGVPTSPLHVPVCCLVMFCQQQSAVNDERLSVSPPTLTTILLSS
jgi:hypothetical protein